jgi:WD40 repeat protein
VSGGKDRMIKVWSSDTDKVLKTPLGTMQNIAVVRTLWLAQNAREIVAGGGDGAVRLFKCHSTETNKHKVTVQKWNLEWEQKIHQDAISAMV